MTPTLIRLPQVLALRGRTRACHYKDIQNGLFTKPVQIGSRAVAWPDYEVNALNAAAIAGQPPEARRELVHRLHEERLAQAPVLH